MNKGNAGRREIDGWTEIPKGRTTGKKQKKTEHRARRKKLHAQLNEPRDLLDRKLRALTRTRARPFRRAAFHETGNHICTRVYSRDSLCARETHKPGARKLSLTDYARSLYVSS